MDCRTQVKGKITLIIKGPVPVDNFQGRRCKRLALADRLLTWALMVFIEDYDLADRRSARNARKSPTSARR